MRVKYILDARDDDMVLALRAAKSMLKHPSTSISIITFSGAAGGTPIEFLVRRTKSGASAKQIIKE